MGKLSSACRQQADLPEAEPHHLPPAVAMGETPTPEQAGPLDTTDASVFVEAARRTLPRLQPEDHETDGVAFPPHPQTIRWRQRRGAEPGAPAPGVSPE